MPHWAGAPAPADAGRGAEAWRQRIGAELRDQSVRAEAAEKAVVAAEAAVAAGDKAAAKVR